MHNEGIHFYAHILSIMDVTIFKYCTFFDCIVALFSFDLALYNYRLINFIFTDGFTETKKKRLLLCRTC